MSLGWHRGSRSRSLSWSVRIVRGDGVKDLWRRLANGGGGVVSQSLQARVASKSMGGSEFEVDWCAELLAKGRYNG